MSDLDPGSPNWEGFELVGVPADAFARQAAARAECDARLSALSSARDAVVEASMNETRAEDAMNAVRPTGPPFSGPMSNYVSALVVVNAATAARRRACAVLLALEETDAALRARVEEERG